MSELGEIGGLDSLRIARDPRGFLIRELIGEVTDIGGIELGLGFGHSAQDLLQIDLFFHRSPSTSAQRGCRGSGIRTLRRLEARRRLFSAAGYKLSADIISDRLEIDVS